MLRYLLPSAVDISGAGIKRTIAINKKRLNHKNKTKYCNSNSVKINVTFSRSFSGAEKKHNC